MLMQKLKIIYYIILLTVLGIYSKDSLSYYRIYLLIPVHCCSIHNRQGMEIT